MKIAKSFKSKITSLMVLMIIVPLVVSTIIIGFITLNNFKANTYSQQLDKANSISKQVNLVLNDVQSTVNFLASSSEAQTMNFDTIDEMSKKVLKNYPFLMDVAVMRPDGMQIYTSAGKSKLGNRADRDYFKKGINGTSGYSDVMISKTFNKPIVLCYAPVKKDGSIIGVLSADLSLDQLNDFVSKACYGKTGQVYIVDKNGKLIGSKDKRAVNSMKDLSKLKPVSYIIKKQSGQVGYTNDNVFKLATYKVLDKVDWGVIVEVASSEAFSKLYSMVFIMAVIIVISLAASLLISFKMSNYITNPINKIGEKLSLVAQYKFYDAKLEGSILNRKDEFGEISKSFNSMIDSISSLIKGIKSSLSTLINSSNVLTNTTDQTVKASDEIASSINEIAEMSTKQAKGTETVADKMTSLAGDIESVSASASEMKNMSQNAVKLTEKGLTTVEFLTKKNEENNKANSEISKVINEVDKSSDKIGIVTETISKITKQTNLLALNAAIEAARAGESGRGFSVVADEVRKLAEQSSEAAKEISGLISEVQKQAKSAVQAIENNQSIVTNQNTAVYETGDLFKNISNTIKDLTDRMNKISRFSDEMSNKKENIVNGVNEISSSVERTSASTEEISAAAEEQVSSMDEVKNCSEKLKQFTSVLQNAVDKFKISKNAN